MRPQAKQPAPKPPPGFARLPRSLIYQPIIPEPFTGGYEIFPRLHRHPVGTLRERDRTSQRDYKINESAVWVGEPACNQRPWQRAAIRVEKNMERIGLDGRFAIVAGDIHFSDIPNLAFGNDEIVSSEAVITV